MGVAHNIAVVTGGLYSFPSDTKGIKHKMVVEELAKWVAWRLMLATKYPTPQPTPCLMPSETKKKENKLKTKN
jgi:hypothetical protein